MADGVDHKFQGKFLQFTNGKWEQFNADMPGTAFLVITNTYQIQYRLDDRGLVTKKTLVLSISDAFKYKFIEEKSFLQWRSEDKKAYGFQFQSNNDANEFISALNAVLSKVNGSDSPRCSNTPDTGSMGRKKSVEQFKSASVSSGTDINQFLNDVHRENKEIKQMLQHLTNKIDNLTSLVQANPNSSRAMPSTNTIPPASISSSVAPPRPPSSGATGVGRPPPPPSVGRVAPPPSSGGGPPPPPPAPSGPCVGGGAPPPPPPGGGAPPPPPPPPPPSGGGAGGGMTLAQQLAAKKLKNSGNSGEGGGDSEQPKAASKPPPMDMFAEMRMKREAKAKREREKAEQANS